MHSELVKRLRYCLSDTVEDCAGCPYQGGYKGTYCMNGLISEAADAIEELSAKATPKRVGFNGWKGCRDTRYKCPYCNKYVRNDETYCHKCGQALMFPRISHTPYVPGKRQEAIISWPGDPPKEATDA